MPEFRCLNKHSHPEDTKGCLEGCMMCCGYCTPSVIGLLVAALAIVSDVYSILLIARNPHSAWRIVVCLIVFVLTTALAAAVCWSYWAIVFTSPGYVPEDPWRHPPRYCGPPLPPRDGDRANSGPGAQHASPSMVRRSPTASGEHGNRPQSNSVTPPPPQQQTQWPAASPIPPEQPSASNPLSDGTEQKGGGGHDWATAAAGAQQHQHQHQQEEEENKTGEVAAGALYSDSGESGKGQRVALALPADRSDTSLNDKVNEENCAPGDVEVPLRRQPSLPGGSRGDVPAGAAPPASHSPFATPMYPHSTVAAAPAAHGAPPPFASPNPYTVTSLTSNGALRFCSICRLYKPDGAHHCRMCGKCVFNFDHHCPFVNNCVGRNNYKLFVLFLLYSGVGATLAGGLMAITLFAVDTGEIMSKIGWIAVPALDVILGLSLLLFYAQHQMLLCKGQSTLESIIQSDNTFAGWRRSHSRPRPTAAEKAEAERKKKVKVERHYRTLFGNESPWWRRYLPLPVRTDVRADDTVAGNV